METHLQGVRYGLRYGKTETAVQMRLSAVFLGWGLQMRSPVGRSTPRKKGACGDRPIRTRNGNVPLVRQRAPTGKTTRVSDYLYRSPRTGRNLSALSLQGMSGRPQEASRTPCPWILGRKGDRGGETGGDVAEMGTE